MIDVLKSSKNALGDMTLNILCFIADETKYKLSDSARKCVI